MPDDAKRELTVEEVAAYFGQWEASRHARDRALRADIELLIAKVCRTRAEQAEFWAAMRQPEPVRRCGWVTRLRRWLGGGTSDGP